MGACRTRGGSVSTLGYRGRPANRPTRRIVSALRVQRNKTLCRISLAPISSAAYTSVHRLHGEESWRLGPPARGPGGAVEPIARRLGRHDLVTAVDGVQILGQGVDLFRRQRCTEGIAHLVDFPHPLIECERRLAQYHSCGVTDQALTGDLRTLTRRESILARRQHDTDSAPTLTRPAGALFRSGLGISGARPRQTGRERDSEQDGNHPTRSNVASARIHDRPPRTQTACTDTDSITLRMNPDAFQLA
jgi:hypothetical protein